MKILKAIIVIFVISIHLVKSKLTISNLLEKEHEEQRFEMISDIITSNNKTNSWTVILTVGHFPDIFYKLLTINQVSFAVTNNQKNDHEVEDIVRYYSDTIVIGFKSYDDFENSLTKATTSPYWHPLSKIILYFRNSEEKIVIAKIFFIMWFYSCPNTILVQYDDDKLTITHYSPYVYEHYKLENNYGCYSLKKLGSSAVGLEGGFKCEETCQNVSVSSKLRANNLGTCIGFTTHAVGYGRIDELRELNLFEDKSKDLHGYIMRASGVEVEPFLMIEDLGGGKYSLHARDGMMSNTLAELMNFTIDLSSNEYVKTKFDFLININEIFGFAQRKSDFLLFPIYQMLLFVIEVDMTIAHKASGVCIMAHRADFETILFDLKVFQQNLDLCLRIASCFIAIWIFYIIFSAINIKKVTADQIGKDLLNTIRNVLSISVVNPSKRRSFRIFLIISLWSFFIINFSAQATITSFFTAIKRGKEVDTFQDVVDKDYAIEGMETPDVILPEDKELFIKINSKFRPILDNFDCVKSLSNDSRKFCLVDCANAHYMEKNWLNRQGEQYLHIVKERIHSNYLNMIMPKNSPLTQQMNKHILRIVESGIVFKWEQYKYNNIKDKATLYTLGMDDVKGIFQCYLILTGIGFICFVFEILTSIFKKIIRRGFDKFQF